MSSVRNSSAGVLCLLSPVRRRLKASCPNCSAPVEPDWKVCPRCTSPLSQETSNIQTPVRKKDRGLWVVLAVVVIVPLAVLLFALFSLTSLAPSSGGGGVTSLPTEEYLAMTDNQEIKQWLENCGDDPNTAYVLRHVVSSETENDSNSLEYLIYMPGPSPGFSCGDHPHVQFPGTPYPSPHL